MQTTQQVLEQQAADAERDTKAKALAKQTPTKPPAPAVEPVPAAPDGRDPRDRYLDRIAPQTIVGRRLKFNTNLAKYVTPDDGAEMDKDASFIALCDQTIIGWRRFHGKGESPSFIVGMWYDGYQPLQVEELPDRDERQWDINDRTGAPEDPWKELQWLVLQRVETGELFTFEASAVTHLDAGVQLLRHFRRREKSHPDEYPIVRLSTSSWSKDGITRHKPQFIVTSHTAKSDATKPAALKDEMDDVLPF